MRKTFKSITRQKGMTLVETMIVIGIIAVVVGLTLGIAPLVRADQKSNELQQQVVQIASQTQALGRGHFNGFTEATLVQSGKIPASWIDGTGAGIAHTEGGTVTIVAADVNGGTDNGALITFSGVKKSSCNTILTNAQENFPVIATSVASAKAYGAGPLTSSAIVAACNATGETVDLMLTVV